VELFQITNRQEWRRVVSSFDCYDFYHTFDFNYISYCNNEGDPVLFYLRDRTNNGKFALPILFREISQKDGHRDATSVYGYPGPLVEGNIDIKSCRLKIIDRLRKLKCVSLFSRVNSFTVANSYLSPLKTSKAGETVYIDLLSCEEAQRDQYRNSHIRIIKKLRKKGIKSWIDNSNAGVDEFFKLYEGAMNRLCANKYYYFNKEYFYSLMASKDFYANLIFCGLDGKTICGGIFTLCSGIVQYHLGATTDNYQKLSPSIFMFDSVRLWGIKQNARIFHLGGGLSGTCDSLLHFKKGFSKNRANFMTLKWIVNNDRYIELTKNRAKEMQVDWKVIANGSFFPAYRAVKSY